MRQLEGKVPFKLDIRRILTKARKLPATVDGISIHLPFVDVSVKPNNLERKIAREVVIRLADRRVLNAFECCDGCIKQALDSLQDIRKVLVDKQVELSSDAADSALYLLLDSIRISIRQFLTFEQHLKAEKQHRNRDLYFAGLEMLRAHIHRTLLQVAKIAEMEIPGISEHMRYNEAWQLEAYKSPAELRGSPRHRKS